MSTEVGVPGIHEHSDGSNNNKKRTDTVTSGDQPRDAKGRWKIWNKWVTKQFFCGKGLYVVGSTKIAKVSSICISGIYSSFFVLFVSYKKKRTRSCPWVISECRGWLPKLERNFDHIWCRIARVLRWILSTSLSLQYKVFSGGSSSLQPIPRKPFVPSRNLAPNLVPNLVDST